MDIAHENARKFIVIVPVRNPDGKLFFKWVKDLFICGTGVIMTECYS